MDRALLFECNKCHLRFPSPFMIRPGMSGLLVDNIIMCPRCHNQINTGIVQVKPDGTIHAAGPTRLFVAVREQVNARTTLSQIKEVVRHADTQDEYARLRAELPEAVAAAMPESLSTMRSWLPILVLLILLMSRRSEPDSQSAPPATAMSQWDGPRPDQRITESCAEFLRIARELDKRGVPDETIRELFLAHADQLVQGGAGTPPTRADGTVISTRWNLLPNPPKNLVDWLHIVASVIGLMYAYPIAKLTVKKLKLELQKLDVEIRKLSAETDRMTRENRDAPPSQ